MTKIILCFAIEGRFGISGLSAYVTSKFGVIGFSESLRLEVKRYGVKVITIEPGPYKYVHTCKFKFYINNWHSLINLKIKKKYCIWKLVFSLSHR